MAADSKQNLKQLRVDNWAVFFLQRLQLLFAKGDCCDLTLKFVTGQELKVHRLVLSTSTSFFESMESNGNVINLPESLPYSVVQPIINFLYSGRLEFKAELHSQLLGIAKIMKLAILARILVAQKNDNGVGDHITSTGKVLDIKKVPYKPSPKKMQSPNTSFVNIIAGKKLPIWKKRTVPYKFERKPVKEEEPRPTRFEWPDEETCTNMLMASPSFSSLSYESAPVISPPVTPPSSASQSLPSTSLKRRVMPPVSSIPDKIFKPDGNASVNYDSKTNEDQLPCDPNVSDDDYDDDGHFETIHSYGDSDDEPDTPLESETPVSHLKPILKPMSDSPLQTPSKKVRFSFAPEDKENKNEKAEENMETVQSKTTEKADITNHTKIIQEVLKKYPELVKNNKNIKLKITAPGSASKQNTITIDTKKKTVQTKSSYIVLKPTINTIKPENINISPSVGTEKISKPSTNTENVKGSWKCDNCVFENEPVKFESYMEFKKHLQEKHERVDSRVCEYCGYKASKRNLHLYHLFTKHGVDPPKNVKFPKCSQCSYIALSESLLVKHLNSHQMAKELTCQVCNTTFKTYSSLHVHSMSCKPNSGVRSYPCSNCKKIFKTNVSLNAHLKVCSVNKEDTDDGGGTHSTDNVIEVPIIETVEMNKGEHALVQIPSGLILAESPNVALLPSSESETLNNVASSIATSIGLTVALPQEHQQAVILLDGNSQFFLQGNESVVVSNDNEVEEYIVPELLRDEMGQIYTTQNVPYTVTTTGVITCPIMSIQSTNELDKDKEGEGNDSTTTLNLSSEHNYAEGELKDGEVLEERTSLLESAETHLESSNTRVEIKDSQAEDIDIANLEKALQSPVSSDIQEDTIQEDILQEGTSLSNHVSEMDSINCESNNATATNDSDIDVINLTEEQHVDVDVDVVENSMDNTEQNNEDNVEENLEENLEESADTAEKSKVEDNETALIETPLRNIQTNEKDKAISLVRDWGFDNEEDTEDDTEDPESRPSRPTMDF